MQQRPEATGGLVYDQADRRIMPRDLSARRLFIASHHVTDGIDRLRGISVVEDAQRCRTSRAAEIRDRPGRDRFLEHYPQSFHVLCFSPGPRTRFSA
jgi:hypothetical protein